MTPAKLLVVATVGLLAAACSYSDTTTQARVPATATVYSSTTVNPAAEAQAACSSYGLRAGTAPYDRCVGREIEARRYRPDAVVVTTYATPAPVSTTTVYTAPVPTSTTTVYTTTAPVSTTRVVPATTTLPAGVQAFRDEYGFRYDGQGNRVDARGNIISPQSTRP